MLSRDAYYSLCFAAGAVLLRGPFTPLPAQDANRAVVESRKNISAIVERLARESGDFQDAFDSAVSHSTAAGISIEVNAKHRADDLHEEAKCLADIFHSELDKNNPAVRDQADKTLAAASELNRVMLSHHFTDKLQRDWVLLCLDFNALAEVYDLAPLGSEDENR
jgi:hypothetical protein